LFCLCNFLLLFALVNTQNNCGLMPCLKLKCPGVVKNSNTTCRVFFRIDDIKDYYITAAQIQIMELFHANNTPVTIGVVAANFGQDKTLLSYLSQIILGIGWEVEIASHGDNHTDFSNYSYAETIFYLQDSLNSISKYLRISGVVSFIPPFYKFNNYTTKALQTVGFTHWSAITQTDSSLPKPLSGQTLYSFPAGASTNSNFTDSTGFVGVPWQTTFTQIEAQLKQYGWAGVVIHPQEFTVNGGSTANCPINVTQLNELSLLLTAVQQQGWQIVPLGRLNLDAPNSTLTGGLITSPLFGPTNSPLFPPTYYVVLGVVAGFFGILCCIFLAAFVRQTISYYVILPVAEEEFS